MAAPCATPVDRLHRRLWPLREHNCEITVTAWTIAGKILCHQLSIGVKHSSTAIRESSKPYHSAISRISNVIPGSRKRPISITEPERPDLRTVPRDFQY